LSVGIREPVAAEENAFLNKLKVGRFNVETLIAKADGEVLGSDEYSLDPDTLRKVLKRALERFRPGSASASEARGNLKRGYDALRPPDVGFVACVVSKSLAPPCAKDKNDLAEERTLGVDRLWVRKDEAEALAQGHFPQSLTQRIGQWHLYDGRHWPYEGRKLESLEIKVSNGRVTGSYEIAAPNSAYKGEILGFVEAKGGQVTRFDLLARGPYGPAGSQVPLAVGFSMADPKDDPIVRFPPYPLLLNVGIERYLR